jgi:hypothetical protein
MNDIKRGWKIKTIMKRHDISATLVLALMQIIDKSDYATRGI